MTLLNVTSKLILAGLLSLATASQVLAAPNINEPDRRGDRPGRPDRPVRPDQPGYGPVPGYPQQPPPQHPGYPAPAPGYGETRITRTAHIQRYVRNEFLPLRRLADIDMHYRGFNVQSVQVIMRPTRYGNANLRLIINRHIQDERSVYNETSLMLFPNGYAEIGEDVNSLQLDVRGEVYIERVQVELVRSSNGGGHHPNPPGYGEMLVDLQLPAYLPPQGRLDLTRYVDTYRYQGMTLVAVEVTANARNNAAIIDVLLNDYNEGTISLSRYTSTQRIHSRQRLMLGRDFRNLVLMPRGDSNVTSVRLVLRR